MKQTLEQRTFIALQSITEGILTRCDASYMQRRLEECVSIIAEHGWQAPTPWRVVTWNSKTSKVFATRQEAIDYIAAHEDGWDWYIEPVRQ